MVFTNPNNEFAAKSDVELLALYKVGNQGSITALIARYASLINKRVSTVTIIGVDNDDIKQEAYMGLLNAIRHFDPNRHTSFYTYANHCIANKLKNMFASATTNKAQLYINSISLHDLNNNQIHLVDSANPELLFIQNEGYELLVKLTESVLSPFERDVLFNYLSGCDYCSIAQKLNSAEKSVDNALQRSRKKLKAVLNGL